MGGDILTAAGDNGLVVKHLHIRQLIKQLFSYFLITLSDTQSITRTQWYSREVLTVSVLLCHKILGAKSQVDPTVYSAICLT